MGKVWSRDVGGQKKKKERDVGSQAAPLIPTHLPVAVGPATALNSVQIFANTLEKALLDYDVIVEPWT